MDPSRITDCSHRTAGDNSGTGNCRLQQDAGTLVVSDDLVRDRGVLHRDLDHCTLGSFHCFADRLGDVIRFTEAITDFAVLVSDNDDCTEGEPASTLHNLRYAVDLDQLFGQTVAFLSISISSVSVPIHTVPLELDPGFAGAVGD